MNHQMITIAIYDLETDPVGSNKDQDHYFRI